MPETKNTRHVVSITTGKYSTALLLRMVEKNMPIDAVLYADTGMELLEAYEHLEKLDQWLCQERGIHITRLKHPHSFEYLLLETPEISNYQRTKRKRPSIPLVGNGWPSLRKRWCCTEMVDNVIDREICHMEQENGVIQYIPITPRYKHLIAPHKHHSVVRYPFMEWNDDCQNASSYCWMKGFSLYQNQAHSSDCPCWCCPFRMRIYQAKLRESDPALWHQLLELERRVRIQFGDQWIGQFRDDYSLQDFEKALSEIDDA